MSATVNYKNNTLTTIGYGSSATLNTQGTWLEDNINIEVDNLNLQNKSVTPSESTQTIIANNQYDGLGQVTVAPIPSEYIIPSGTLSITDNGTYDVTNYASADVSTMETHVVTVTDTIDPVNGGTIRNINAIDISDTTATASDVASGKYFYTADGTKTTGTKISDETYNDTINTILTRTISGSYENSEITSIGNYAFADCDNLTSANFSNCTTIGSSAFYGCSNLTSISFPNCTTIGSYAFGYCSHLISVDFPNCTIINSNAFYSCSHLTSVSFPNCTKINTNAFYSCYLLTSINFPNCINIMGSAFRNCYALSEINFPKVTSVGASAFQNCSSLATVNFGILNGALGGYAFYQCQKLESINLANTTSIGVYAFYRCYQLSNISALSASIIGGQAFGFCSSLTSISLPGLTSLLGSSAFSNCIALESVYLLGTTIPTTISTTPFVSTPLDNSTYLGYYGSIYVRESLLASWQTKANISIYADRMVGLTDEQIAALDS